MRNNAYIWAEKWGLPVAFGLMTISMQAHISADRPPASGSQRQVGAGFLLGDVAGLERDSAAIRLVDWLQAPVRPKAGPITTTCQRAPMFEIRPAADGAFAVCVAGFLALTLPTRQAAETYVASIEP